MRSWLVKGWQSDLFWHLERGNRLYRLYLGHLLGLDVTEIYDLILHINWIISYTVDVIARVERAPRKVLSSRHGHIILSNRFHSVKGLRYSCRLRLILAARILRGVFKLHIFEQHLIELETFLTLMFFFLGALDILVGSTQPRANRRVRDKQFRF